MDSKILIRLSPVLCILLALMLLILPLKWIIAAIIAAAYHEFCHIAAIQFLGGNIRKFTLSTNGANLHIDELPPVHELICSLAGPLGGLCLLFFAKWIPRVAICAALQSMYNLLPIYPLDGGRALWCGMSLFLPAKITAKMCKIVETLCITGILLIAVYAAVFLKLGISAFFPAILIVTHTKFRKTPCKESPQQLQ